MGNCSWGGTGSGADELVKVTAADTTPDYLNPKIAAGAGIATAVLNPGGNEQLQISAPGLPAGSSYGGIHTDGTPASQSIPNATYTKIARFNANGISSDTTPDQANDQITIGASVGGPWQISCDVSFESDANVTWDAWIRVNGTRRTELEFHETVDETSKAHSCSCDAGVTVGNSDVIDIVIRQNSGGAKNITFLQLSLFCHNLGSGGGATGVYKTKAFQAWELWDPQGANLPVQNDRNVPQGRRFRVWTFPYGGSSYGRIYGVWPTPENWDAINIYVQLYWAIFSGAVGSVDWRFNCSAQGDNEDLNTAGTWIDPVDTAATVDYLYITPEMVIVPSSVAGLVAGDLINWRVERLSGGAQVQNDVDLIAVRFRFGLV